MICNEKGVFPKSQYFFFTPSEMFSKYYYYMLVCGHFYCNSGYRIQRDGHVDPLIVYVVNGQFNLNYEGKQYIASKGEIVLVDCQKPHTYYSGHTCEFLFFHFSGSDSYSIVNHLISQNNGAVFKLENSQQIYTIMNSTITKLYYDQPLDDIELSCIVYNTLCSLQAFNEILPTTSSPISDTILDVIYYIKANIYDNYTLNMLANYANLSPYYFSHLFKNETGYSPIEYVTLLKLNLAKTMLKTSSKSISEIAISLGYSSSSSFINAFKSRVGVSPNRFRNVPSIHER